MASVNWVDQLRPGVQKVFFERMREEDYNLAPAVNVLVEDSVEDMTMVVKAEFTYDYKRYGKAIKISRKLLEDDQYSIIDKQITALAKVTARTWKRLEMGTFNQDEAIEIKDDLTMAVNQAVRELKYGC